MKLKFGSSQGLKRSNAPTISVQLKPSQVSVCACVCVSVCKMMNKHAVDVYTIALVKARYCSFFDSVSGKNNFNKHAAHKRIWVFNTTLESFPFCEITAFSLSPKERVHITNGPLTVHYMIHDPLFAGGNLFVLVVFHHISNQKVGIPYTINSCCFGAQFISTWEVKIVAHDCTGGSTTL